MTTLTIPYSIDAYREDFERALQDAAGNIPGWLRQHRQTAFRRFAELGYPTRRDEEWRVTDVRPIADTVFAVPEYAQGNVTPEQIGELFFPTFQANRLVFVNGRYSAELSHTRELPAGVRIGRLRDLAQNDPTGYESALQYRQNNSKTAFTSLNFAFFEDGAYIHIPRNVVVTDPIMLIYVSNSAATPTASHPLTFIHAEENSHATVIETYIGVGADMYFTNAVTEVSVRENAVLDHIKITQEKPGAYHVATTEIALARGANFTSHNITLGGQIVRNDFNAGLNGEGIECTLNGVYVARDKQLVDNHTSIDHAMPHCNSHELYKGILDGRARGVFNGKIFVREDAQKTDAKQTNQTLLLSNDATINTKPQLEIYADDVRCTHGATVGQLNQDALFYLRTRGIGKDEARAMLTFAFANDVVSRIKLGPVRMMLEHLLLTQLRNLETV